MERKIVRSIMGAIPDFIVYLVMIYLFGPVLQAVLAAIVNHNSGNIFYICHIVVSTSAVAILYSHYRTKWDVIIDDEGSSKMNVKEALQLTVIVILWGHFCMVIAVFISLVLGTEDSAASAIQDNSNALLMFCSVVVISPIAEEFVFRRIIYGKLRQELSCISALILVSLFWAAAHGSLLLGLNAFLMSIVYTLIYERYRTIKWPIFAHALSNAISLLTAVDIIAEPYSAFMAYIMEHHWLLLVLCVELGIVTILFSKFPEQKQTESAPNIPEQNS